MIRATQVKLNLFYFRCITKVAVLTFPEDYNIFTARKQRKMCTAIQPLLPVFLLPFSSPSRSNPAEGKKRGPWNEFLRHLYPPHTAHYHLPVAYHSWKTDAGYYVEKKKVLDEVILLTSLFDPVEDCGFSYGNGVTLVRGDLP